MRATERARVIDADAHVIETERTWEYIPDAHKHLRPRVLVPQEGGAEEFWFVEGRAFRKNLNQSDEAPSAAREARDIAARVRHMDELEVDVHVLYPTIFLRPLTHHADQDVALCRAYNRWLADIWAQAPQRLRWVVVPPLLDMNAAIEEMRYGKEHGACGVFMMGMGAHLRLSDSALFPLYEEAVRLDMPICIHAGAPNFTGFDLMDRDYGFSIFKLPAVGAFHDLLMHHVPERFPALRWAFVETSASWLPYAMNDLMLRFRRYRMDWPGADVLRANNIYVACQTADDLPYVLEAVGDDHIVLGTDYGHNDTATELLGLRRLRESGVVSPDSADRILGLNPARLYGL